MFPPSSCVTFAKILRHPEPVSCLNRKDNGNTYLIIILGKLNEVLFLICLALSKDSIVLVLISAHQFHHHHHMYSIHGFQFSTVLRCQCKFLGKMAALQTSSGLKLVVIFFVMNCLNPIFLKISIYKSYYII